MGESTTGVKGRGPAEGVDTHLEDGGAGRSKANGRHARHDNFQNISVLARKG